LLKRERKEKSEMLMRHEHHGWSRNDQEPLNHGGRGGRKRKGEGPHRKSGRTEKESEQLANSTERGRHFINLSGESVGAGVLERGGLQVRSGTLTRFANWKILEKSTGKLSYRGGWSRSRVCRKANPGDFSNETGETGTCEKEKGFKRCRQKKGGRKSALEVKCPP